jgi:PAS domain S-box-containing protein
VSDEVLGAVISLMPDAAVIVDADGTIVAVNEHAESLFGYGAGGMIGLSIEALVPERSRQRHRGHRSGYLAAPQRRPMGAELNLTGRRQDGSEIPVDISLAPLSSGGRQLVMAAIRDITERRAAWAALAQLAAIISSSLDAILAMTLAGEITTWNPGAVALFGHEPEEIVGQHISVLVPDESSLALEEMLGAASEGRHLQATDTSWRRNDGKIVDVAVSISPLNDERGNVDGYSAVVRDISDRKRAEQELRRLLAEEERLERQHAAMSEIRLALLSERSLEESLQLICDRAGEILRAASCGVSVRAGEGLRLVAASGAAVPLIGSDLPIDMSFAARVITSAEVLQIDHLRDMSSMDLPEGVPNGPTLGVPIIVGGVTTGALAPIRVDTEPQFTAGEVATAEALAAQAALAFELDRSRHDREQVMLATDRERIARDLHDHVIQQLFATGMSLQSLSPFLERRDLRDRLATAIDGLDDTIREIRNTIYGLSWSQTPDQQLRSKLLEIVANAEEQLGFSPAVRFEGPIDVAIPDEVGAHVLAVVQEALSNVARHAHASEVQVQVLLEEGGLRVTVADNGAGIGEITRSSGLSNLEERARLAGGRLMISPVADGGTRLDWIVPL